MSLENDLSDSREYEMKTYLSSLQSMYENSVIQNGEIYDIAAEQTQNKPVVVSVIAGFFTQKGISNLKASNVAVVWEHRLKDLESIL
ncbi:hypothetical protein MNBD_GAMMA26-507 [hydrothermal vent metagenome]|uniref:Uncharacterized protein n=1 Tax=hydrothermal vent metagenome TaxID=652676 RepID=A0A3B1AQK2_9ZZZZ